MGSYLGKDDDATDDGYAASVRGALALGVNVIDTAINYRNMRSERALGRGLAEAFAAGEAAREEVFFCTKAGYVPFDGAVPRDARKYIFETYVQSRLAMPSDVVSGCHCMTPDYLHDQIARSLLNTGLDAIDLFYVHNPEQQLDEISLDRFFDRWKLACAALEAEVAAGRIGGFGAATWNGFRVPPEVKGHLPLETMVRIAEAEGGREHHFRAIQFPFSAAMLDAGFAATQDFAGNRVPLLEAASQLDLTCFCSVPLLQGRLTRGLPDDFRAVFENLATDAQRALQFVRSTPGVHAPLAGMKTPAHVEENAAVLRRPPATREQYGSLFRPVD
jgi:aryl-alcohol dehydrogenase-like predicted oxidoreductase